MPTLQSVRSRVRGRTELCAAVITAVAVCVGDALARTYPFGSKTRNLSDLGNQFVPFHAHLWDLLHGKADGGILLNWQSGFGAASLPDIGTYLTSPFALLVGLFPRDRIDLALYVVTVLKMAAAAAAMAALLPRLTRRRRAGGSVPADGAGNGAGRHIAPWWAAAVLGATYGLCGWSVIEASYNPMWLDGLIAFPLLCLVGEWARDGRRRVVGPLIVGLAWTANFYTAYMATIGAALVLIVRLLLDQELDARDRIRVIVRAAWRVVLGIVLSLPILLPVYLGTKHAYPGWTTPFDAAPWTDVFARALPGTYSFFTPAVFLGAAGLLLAAGLPFDRNVPWRERGTWFGLVLAVALSVQWGPTSLAWHAFAIPNGSPYRETFILAGVLVMAAWMSLSRGWPGKRPLLCGAGLLVALALGAASSGLGSKRALGLFVLGTAGTACGLLLARLRHRGVALLAALLLAGSLAGEAAATTAHADRARLKALDHYPASWGTEQQQRADAVAKADHWPTYRTDPGREQITGNDPIYIGGEGAGYYSSMTSDDLTTTMKALGGGWTSQGRVIQSLDNPVTDAIFSIGARVHTLPGKAPVTTHEDVPPLVTVRPKTLPADVATGAADHPGTGLPRFGPSAFRNQEALLGARVYTEPASKVCPVGTDEYIAAPDYFGTARLGDNQPASLTGRLPKRRAAMAPLGTVRKAGTQVSFVQENGTPTPPKSWSVGCLDRGKLTAAVAHLKQTGAVSVDVSDSGVHARVPAGSTGYAVLSAPRIAGWTCNGKPAASYLGLVAVPLDGTTTIDCSFRPPGLEAGGAAGIAGGLALVAIAAFARRFRVTNSSSTNHPHVVRDEEFVA